ncbi:DNA-binding transcriptional regulator, MarR family [Ensifer adhaerens]|nr:DNA-binding transcriptional regulator, MarR family [Ensifer adhaerens]
MAEQKRDPEFDLEQFLPYLLNQAAEATSHSFQAAYRDLYGMTRTQWRVMANLGKFGSMTAKDICVISHIEKTKVSRSVTALESAGFLLRTPSEDDRRAEFLSLTDRGMTVFREIGKRANTFDAQLRAELGETAAQELVKALEFLKKRGL